MLVPVRGLGDAAAPDGATLVTPVWLEQCFDTATLFAPTAHPLFRPNKVPASVGGTWLVCPPAIVRTLSLCNAGTTGSISVFRSATPLSVSRKPWRGLALAVAQAAGLLPHDCRQLQRLLCDGQDVPDGACHCHWRHGTQPCSAAPKPWLI